MSECTVVQFFGLLCTNGNALSTKVALNRTLTALFKENITHNKAFIRVTIYYYKEVNVIKFGTVHAVV